MFGCLGSVTLASEWVQTDGRLVTKALRSGGCRESQKWDSTLSALMAVVVLSGSGRWLAMFFEKNFKYFILCA